MSDEQRSLSLSELDFIFSILIVGVVVLSSVLLQIYPILWKSHEVEYLPFFLRLCVLLPLLAIITWIIGKFATRKFLKKIFIAIGWILLFSHFTFIQRL